MSGHAPGPWFVVERCAMPLAYSVVNQVKTNGNFLETNCICHVSITTKHAEADARLIAAAPDLLAALEKLLPGLLTAAGRLELHDILAADELVRMVRGS